MWRKPKRWERSFEIAISDNNTSINSLGTSSGRLARCVNLDDPPSTVKYDLEIYDTHSQVRALLTKQHDRRLLTAHSGTILEETKLLLLFPSSLRYATGIYLLQNAPETLGLVIYHFEPSENP